MDLISQWINIDFVWGLISSGFLLGGLVGAVVGASVWTMLQRGSTGLWWILIGAAVGLVFGIVWEGQGFSPALGSSLETFFGSGSSVRFGFVNTVILLLGYVAGFMAIGAFIHNLKRALSGFLLGGVLGTLAGMIFLLVAQLIDFPITSALTPVLVGIIAAMFMAFLALGDTSEAYRPSRQRKRR